MFVPNQFERKAALTLVLVSELVSRKITDSPGAMLVIPLIGTEAAKDCVLSSTFQPVMSTGVGPMLESSNQSAATMGLLPLDQGATSEMTTLLPIPGEPISLVSFAATNAPCPFTVLNWEMTVPFRPT